MNVVFQFTIFSTEYGSINLIKIRKVFFVNDLFLYLVILIKIGKQNAK